ncbi:MAG TPA: DUF4886 domain-containing protein [Candidatus Limnocylindrales bacterium]
MRRLVAVLACCLVLVLPVGCAPAAGCANAQVACTRVVFIGNSYTYVNDLPAMVAGLARAGGHQIETGMAAEGGWTLADHVKSSATQATLASARWDVAVLQEQSEIPAIEQFRTGQMFPAARDLVRTVRLAGARPMFFLTWAHRDGWPENRLPDYASMQTAIDQGYLAIAGELGVPVAPAGAAWSTVVARNARPGLWQDDGSHPSVAGTYLAACVFYAALFHQSPVGLAYAAGLPNETTASLQQVAADTVLTDQAHWGLP